MRLTQLFTLLSIMTVAICSCSDDDYNDRALLSEIVTATRNTPDGIEFQYRRYGDSPLITLTADGFSVKDEFIGKRMLLRYYNKSEIETSPRKIEIAALSAINNDTARIADIDTIAWNATPIYLNSIWRSGQYINVHLKVMYSATARLFNLTADSATIDSDIPQLYMCHNTFSAPDNYMFETYSSYDISNIWNRPTCKGIDIHVNDSNLKTDTYSFKKQ